MPDFVALSENLQGLIYISAVLLILFFSFVGYLARFLNNMMNRLIASFEKTLSYTQTQLTKLSETFIEENRNIRQEFSATTHVITEELKHISKRLDNVEDGVKALLTEQNNSTIKQVNDLKRMVENMKKSGGHFG